MIVLGAHCGFLRATGTPQDLFPAQLAHAVSKEKSGPLKRARNKPRASQSPIGQGRRLTGIVRRPSEEIFLLLSQSRKRTNGWLKHSGEERWSEILSIFECQHDANS